tara:strand:- start:972 stop:1937 length:966 start_codon:yes stop_codon:yes gene_type:complete
MMDIVHKETLVDMLKWMRPAYSNTEADFCDYYLKPFFGEPDEHGNYIKIIGLNPNVCFTAHTDTVHRQEGMQTVLVKDDVVTTATGSCLGADCTTGLWLLMGMIEAGIEGVYVAHAAEEIGGIGSTALVSDRPAWLSFVDFVISFDRYGTKSIITEQGGLKTASDSFADGLSKALDMPQLVSDPTGTYTDSYEYAGVVSECTNLSVGYYNQHTRLESQDLGYAVMLLEKLCGAHWGSLVAYRDHTLPEYGYGYGGYSTDDTKELETLERIIEDKSAGVAELLFKYGFTVDDLAEEMDLSPTELDRYVGYDDCFDYHGYLPY